MCLIDKNTVRAHRIGVFHRSKYTNPVFPVSIQKLFEDEMIWISDRWITERHTFDDDAAVAREPPVSMRAHTASVSSSSSATRVAHTASRGRRTAGASKRCAASIIVRASASNNETVVASRRAMMSFLGVSAASALANAPNAEAEVAPEFVDETMEIIGLCRSIMRGETVDEATLETFQDKRRAWFAKYQYKHGKSFYGYANTWNAQAKIGVQIAVDRENGVPFDPEHTVYNRDYLLSILDKGEVELLDMQRRNAF
jgi:hypothetical protein